MSLRRPNLIRWSPYMDQCIEILEKSSKAFPSDKILCLWARAQHIAEEVGIQFAMDDPVGEVSLIAGNTVKQIKGFEGRLEEWRRDAEGLQTGMASRSSDNSR